MATRVIPVEVTGMEAIPPQQFNSGSISRLLVRMPKWPLRNLIAKTFVL